MRQAGMLLHISSLPSEYSIGSIGKSAYQFIDFLEKACYTYRKERSDCFGTERE